MTPLTEFSEKNHFLGPKVAAIDPCLIEISLCAIAVVEDGNVIIFSLLVDIWSGDFKT